MKKVICFGLLIFLLLAQPVVSAVGSSSSLLGRCCDDNTITVTGQGQVQAKPDSASISVSITNTSSTAAVALSNVNQGVAKVLALFAGRTDVIITTSSLSIYPKTVYNSTTQNSDVVGQTASYSLQIILNGTSSNVGAGAAAIVDQVAKVAGVELSYVSFQVANPQPYQKQARAQAFANGQSTAQDIANLAKATLGAIISVVDSPSVSYTTYPVAFALSAQTANTPTQLLPGSQTFSYTVQIRFSFS